MKARRALVFIAALAVVLVANHEVRADPIHWSYVSSVTGQPPISDPLPGTPFAPFIIYAQNHVAGFSSDFPGPSGSFAGSSKILVGNLWPFDFDKSPNAGPIGLGTSYETDILVTDAASQSSHEFRFLGALNGSISPLAYQVSSTFYPTSQSTMIGGNLYTVSIGPFVAPTAPVDTGAGGDRVGSPGTISAFVDPQPGAHNTPEPSCLALAGMGLGCLAAARLLRGRWQRPVLATP